VQNDKLKLPIVKTFVQAVAHYMLLEMRNVLKSVAAELAFIPPIAKL
jgi:hypothetical protein